MGLEFTDSTIEQKQHRRLKHVLCRENLVARRTVSSKLARNFGSEGLPKGTATFQRAQRNSHPTNGLAVSACLLQDRWDRGTILVLANNFTASTCADCVVDALIDVLRDEATRTITERELCTARVVAAKVCCAVRVNSVVRTVTEAG